MCPYLKYQKVLKEMSLPRNSKEVKQFLGLLGHHYKFISDFANMATPLTSLTTKGVSFALTEECQKAIELSKQSLIEELIL